MQILLLIYGLLFLSKYFLLLFHKKALCSADRKSSLYILRPSPVSFETSMGEAQTFVPSRNNKINNNAEKGSEYQQERPIKAKESNKYELYRNPST